MRGLDEAIRQVRRESGWTQTELADRLQTTPATISRWERGRAWPRYHHLKALLGLLDLPPGDLRRPAIERTRGREERLNGVADRVARTLDELLRWPQHPSVVTPTRQSAFAGDRS